MLFSHQLHDYDIRDRGHGSSQCPAAVEEERAGGGGEIDCFVPICHPPFQLNNLFARGIYPIMKELWFIVGCLKKKKKQFKETKMAKNVYPSPQIDSESSEYSYDDVMVRGRSETETKPILSVREFTWIFSAVLICENDP